MADNNYVNKSRPVIAVDGTAASGKGTLARRLAALLGYAWLDTGLLYRRVGLDALRAAIAAGVGRDDPGVAAAAARQLQGIADLSVLNDPALRGDEAGAMASLVGAVPDVRVALVDIQRNFALYPPALADGRAAAGTVLDGRDIGTAICPDAPLKFYVTATTETRASRRFKELQSAGIPVTYGAVLKEMQERDHRDASRAFRPMTPAPDAVLLETTALNADQVFEAALVHVRQKGLL